eukprot:TRINITY_DN3597_c0_g1_i1.p2 TRINITY_DN3597_c0_g1~~TRINITY_DN3597_c0_g1_i1.p2  ORF type:complete len:103 (-),score=42.69 TRINITY_DN3597_c0_g1_i1:143-451(-)
MASGGGKALTQFEAELYDRGIRVWGVDAQQRLGSSAVLALGMTGCCAEVCKNLALAGVSSIVVLDGAAVTEVDPCSNFFLTADDVGKNVRACLLLLLFVFEL